MDVDFNDSDVILVTGEDHRVKGNEHYKNLNYEAALDCYTAAIDTEPNVALFYSNRSAANLMMFRYSDALSDAKKACDLDPTNIKSLIRLCKCQMILGYWDSAKSVLEIMKELDKDNKEITLQFSDLSTCNENFIQYQSQNEKGDFRHALHCIDNCLKVSHSSEKLKLIKVELLVNLKRYVEAKELIEKQIIDDKNGDNQTNTEALFYRGLCFYYMEHLDKALTHFQHVLKLSPDHNKALQAYKRCKKLSQLKDEGNKLVRTCQYTQAQMIYTDALMVDPANDSMNAKLLFNRSLTLQKLGEWQEALEDCDRAMQLDPSYEKVRTRRVQCLMGLERWEEAVQESTRLQQQQPCEEHTRVLKEAQLGLKRSKQVDLYKVLGVPRSASEADLKKGYRKRALVHHPDRHSHADEATRKAEEIKFKEVNTAYSVLSDPRKKQLYDSGADIDEVLGNGGGAGGFHGGDPYEVFQAFFSSGGGGGGGGGQKFSFHFQ